MVVSNINQRKTNRARLGTALTLRADSTTFKQVPCPRMCLKPCLICVGPLGPVCSCHPPPLNWSSTFCNAAGTRWGRSSSWTEGAAARTVHRWSRSQLGADWLPTCYFPTYVIQTCRTVTKPFQREWTRGEQLANSAESSRPQDAAVHRWTTTSGLQSSAESRSWCHFCFFFKGPFNVAPTTRN